jgi:hypothetical protein
MALGGTAGAVGSASVYINDVTVTEPALGNGTATFTVLATGLSEGESIPVAFSTANGSAKSPEDYNARAGTVTLTSSSPQASIAITIRSDLQSEDDENFSVNLSRPSGAPAYTIADDQGFGTIVDPSGGPPAISISDTTVNEGDSATFRVTLHSGPLTSGTVDYYTADDTASSATDYTNSTGTVTFTSGGPRTQTVTVPTTEDGVPEGTEDFKVLLTAPSSGLRIANDRGFATIVDDDVSTGTVPPVGSTGPIGGGGGGGGGTGGGGGGTGTTTTVPGGDIPSAQPIAPGQPRQEGKGDDPPLPTARSTGNLQETSGNVYVLLPGASSYIPVDQIRQIPVGTIVDATDGAARLFVDNGRGAFQNATFYEGAFVFTQGPISRAQTRSGRLTTLATLVGGKRFSECASSKQASAARVKQRRRLWGRGKGRFRTRGRHGAATVRGTWWLTADYCDGTYVYVREGSVDVLDLARSRTVVVRARHSYFARARTQSKRGS